jgi:redox-sensitive bicupin YhaK (pirin superfamily)
MITLRRNTVRRHVQRGNHDIWLTFYPHDPQDMPADGFNMLAAFNEMQLHPGGGLAPHRRDDAEIVTYVVKGALAQEDSTGSSSLLQVGEFQRLTTGRGNHRKETNASRTDGAHIFRISLYPSEVGLDYAYEQKRFTAAQRRNVLCVTASPDGRKGSLRLHLDALIYSSILDPGYHLVHELLPKRSAWLHIVDGEVKWSDIILTRGDGAGVTNEPSVSLTVQENTEILLVDLGPAPNAFRPPPAGNDTL